MRFGVLVQDIKCCTWRLTSLITPSALFWKGEWASVLDMTMPCSSQTFFQVPSVSSLALLVCIPLGILTSQNNSCNACIGTNLEKPMSVQNPLAIVFLAMDLRLSNMVSERKMAFKWLYRRVFILVLYLCSTGWIAHGICRGFDSITGYLLSNWPFLTKLLCTNFQVWSDSFPDRGSTFIE